MYIHVHVANKERMGNATLLHRLQVQTCTHTYTHTHTRSMYFMYIHVHTQTYRIYVHLLQAFKASEQSYEIDLIKEGLYMQKQYK